MKTAIAHAPVSGFPDRTFNPWKSRGALIALLATVLAVLAVVGSGEAAGCGGDPLTIAELTLPDLTNPA